MTLNEFLSKAEDFFKGNAAAKEQISTVQTEAQNLKTELTEARRLNGELSEKLVAAESENKQLKEKAEQAEKDHKSALEAKEADVEKRASAKALEINANLGVPAGTIKADKSKDAPKTETEKVLAKKGKI